MGCAAVGGAGRGEFVDHMDRVHHARLSRHTTCTLYLQASVDSDDGYKVKVGSTTALQVNWSGGDLSDSVR